MTRCVPVRRTDRVRRGARRVVVGREPVRAPLPHVAGHVVQPEAVRRERVDRRGAVPAVGAACSRPGTLPATRSCGARRRARARRPTGTAAARARRGPRTPTRPRSAAGSPAHAQYACASSHETWTTGWSLRSVEVRLRALGVRPVRAEHLAPPRRAGRRRGCPGSRRAAGRRTRTTSRTARRRSRDRSPATNCRKSRVRDRLGVDEERPQRHLVDRALAVGLRSRESSVPMRNAPPSSRTISR